MTLTIENLSVENFCSSLNECNDSCKTLGCWFDRFISDPIDWNTCNDCDAEVIRHDACENLVLKSLYAAHGISQCDCHSMQELCAMISPKEQCGIWKTMVACYLLDI